MSTVEGGSRIVTDGLVLYLDAANTRSYVSGNTEWNDLSVGTNIGTLTNGPTFNSGNNGSISFDGVDDRCTINNSNILTPYNIPGQKITVDIWMKTTFTPGFGIIMNFGQFYNLEINNVGYGIGYNTLVGDLYGINTNLYPNTWFNLSCIVTQGSVTSNKMYLDGIQQAIGYFLGESSNNTNAVFNSPIMLADYYNSPGVLPLNMNLSLIKIYNRELNQTEILQNYNALKGRFN